MSNARPLAALAALVLIAAAPAPAGSDARFDTMVADVKAQMLADPARAISAAENALRFAESAQSDRMEATAKWLLGEAYIRTEQPARAAPFLAQARALVEQAAPESELHANILLSEAGVLTATGKLSPALADLHKAHTLFEKAGDQRSQAKALIMIALVHFDGNDFTGTLRYFKQADDAYKADPGLSVAVHNGRGIALKELHRYTEAEREIGAALVIAREMKGPLLIAQILTNVAGVRLMKQDVAGAGRAITEGMALTRSADAAAYRPLFVALAAQAALARGELVPAEKLIEARFRDTDLTSTLLPDRPAHETAYRIYTRLGRTDLALPHLAALKRLDDQATEIARSNSAALAGAQFDFANQELRIAKLKADDLQKSVAFERAQARTQRLIFLGIAGATLLIISLLGFGLFTIRRSRNALAVSNIALGKALTAKTEFLATTSHEIRTPLNGILGMTQVMLADPKVDAATRDRLGVVHGAGVTMRALVDDILDSAKMETGKMTIEEAPLDARRTIADAARMWGETAAGKGLGFTLSLDDGPDWIVGDAARLRQIVFNLLSNAVKFTPEGAVTVNAAVHGERWRLTVVDTGIGIAAEHHEQIFEPFRQADSGTTRQFGGTGLGLSICRNLSRAMGGDVTVESAAGEGATFTLDLPLRLAASPEATPCAHEGVLILDRNPIARAMLKALLEPRGGPASFAATAAEALDRISTAAPATILIDDATLRAEEDWLASIAALATAAPGATIALIGPALDPADRAAIECAGVRRFITKPITKEALVIALFDDEPSTTALVPQAA